VNFALGAQPDWLPEKKLPEGLTILKTTTAAWDANKGQVLTRILRDWSEAPWTLPATRRLILVISIVTRRRESVSKQILEITRHQLDVNVSVITLPEIERGHAANWAGLPELRCRCRSAGDTLLSNDI